MSTKKKKQEKTEKFEFLEESKDYPGMYYVRYPDGTLSQDFYNKTRAVYFYHIFDIDKKTQEIG